ncbi:hypothetical protein JIN85_03265 [Luteolibacter pohnpeiensis]|uniref:Uncharacterized protein n=1 Tax=Luteolibacter pohnpeiensis TaxID=454153 RepID=A0A934VVD5_9BACT|nr:hypothetical protein [Luteolibacter pohnpeiensis]MBK1881419.1 hypothetical protein [Luteolibacter pohnpeiensis]
MSDSINPYEVLSPSGADLNEGVPIGCYRERKYLWVRDGAVLPDVCLITNAPGHHQEWRRRNRLIWNPLVALLILFSLGVIGILFFFLLQKKASVSYTLQRRFRRRWVYRNWIGGILLISSAVALGTGFNFADEWTYSYEVMSGLSLLLLMALILLVTANPIKVVGYRNGWFKLKGCSPDFLDSLPIFPAAYKD